MHQYRAFSRVERGYRHIKRETVCQDYALASDAAPGCSVIVVADGHGGGDYFRSDRGAKFVVQAAASELMDFGAEVAAVQLRDPGERRTLLRALFTRIIHRWEDSIAADMFDDPFSETQMENVNLRCRKEYMEGKDVNRAYGTTLVAMLVTEHYWLGIQQGDGRCVAIRADGSCEQPIPWDERCENNITTSICDAKAVEEFRYSFSERMPAAVFVTSDGVDAAYTNMDEMYGFCQQLASIYLEDGRQGLEKALGEFLPNLSKRGTGDDVSIAGLLCVDLLEPVTEVLDLEEKLRRASASWEFAGHDMREHESEQTEAQRALDEVRAEISHLESRRVKDEEDLQHLQEEIEQLQENANKKDAELQQLREKIKKAKEQETEAQKRVDFLEKERQALQKVLDDAAHTVEYLMDESDRVRKQAAAQKRKNNEAEEESYEEDYTEPWAFVNRKKG